MSYCRFGNGSDVYMYGDDEALVCCACRLTDPRTREELAAAWRALAYIELARVGVTPEADPLPEGSWLAGYVTAEDFALHKALREFDIAVDGPWYEDRRFERYPDAIAHLRLHVLEGHEVPSYAIERLKEERRRWGPSYPHADEQHRVGGYARMMRTWGPGKRNTREDA